MPTCPSSNFTFTFTRVSCSETVVLGLRLEIVVKGKTTNFRLEDDLQNIGIVPKGREDRPCEAAVSSIEACIHVQ